MVSPMTKTVSVRLSPEQVLLLRDRTKGKRALLEEMALPVDASVELLEYVASKPAAPVIYEGPLIRITYEDTPDGPSPH